MRRQFRVVLERRDLLQAIERLLGSVDRLGVFPASGVLVALGTLSFHLLDVGTVRQQYADQVVGGGSGVDRPAEAFRHQLRQQAAVVDMGMGQQDEGNVARREMERHPVAPLRDASALEHAAIHQEFDTAGFDQIARAGNFMRGAEKSEPHVQETA